MIWDWRVRGFGRGGRVWRRPKKVNLGRKWVQTEDEGKSSCEKLRAVSAVLLEVAVCQNTLQKIESMQSTEHWIFGPPERPAPGWGPTELPINHPRWPLLVFSRILNGWRQGRSARMAKHPSSFELLEEGRVSHTSSKSPGPLFFQEPGPTAGSIL